MRAPRETLASSVPAQAGIISNSRWVLAFATTLRGWPGIPASQGPVHDNVSMPHAELPELVELGLRVRLEIKTGQQFEPQRVVAADIADGGLISGKGTVVHEEHVPGHAAGLHMHAHMRFVLGDLENDAIEPFGAEADADASGIEATAEAVLFGRMGRRQRVRPCPSERYAIGGAHVSLLRTLVFLPS